MTRLLPLLLGLLALPDKPAAAGELDLQIVAEDFDLSADTERSVRRILTRLHGSYEAWLGLVLPATLPLSVSLVEGEAAYRGREIAVGAMPGHTNGFFRHDTREITVWRGQGDASARETLVHETSHFLLVVAGMGRVPKWLQEGMAEVAETATVDGNAVWLVPGPPARYFGGRTRPRASALIGLDPAAWRALGPTPWASPEYPYGWALCAFLLETDAGRRTLGEILASTAVGSDPGGAALAAVERSWPGGSEALDRAFASWQPSRIQLPIRTDAGPAAGWGKCPDGSLVRLDSGAKCSRWVAGPDGTMRFVEEAPVR